MMPTAPERATSLECVTSPEPRSTPPASLEPRLAPHDLESEQAVLGAILVQPRRWHEAAAVLRAECFFRVAHQQIFAALAALDEARAPFDPLSLADQLQRARQLDAAGGVAYLTRLTDGVPRGVHLRYHAERVRDLWRKRQVIALAHSLLDDAHDERRSADELSAAAETGLIDLTRQVDSGDFLGADALMAKTNAYLRRLASGESGVPSGFRLLDRLLGGFRAGEMVIVGGRPGDGKTSFALSVALHAAVERRLPVAIFSIEMSAEEVGMRLATALARVDASRVRDRRLSPSEHESLTAAIARLEASPLFTDDSALITVAAMRARARRLKTTHGLALLIVDYVQLLVSERRGENRNAEVSVISRGLKILARDLQVPVLVLAQLNRQVMARPDKRPFLSDLRDSGALEQDADVVLFLFREELYHPEAPKGFAECIVAKARHAPTGTVPLTYLDHCTRFENHAGGR